MTLAFSPWTSLLALDRLNSWLRSEQPHWCGIRSALKPVIYWTKTKAILDMSKKSHIGLRRVMVKKECVKCGGTGSYISIFDDCDCCDSMTEFRAKHGRKCRGCGGTGIATLKFVESIIGPVRWHTPHEKWDMSSLDVYVPFPAFYGRQGDDGYEYAADWQPQQKGRPMPLRDVQRDMLIILREWKHEVSFSIDFHHHAKIENTWMMPDLRKAEQWIESLFANGRPL